MVAVAAGSLALTLGTPSAAAAPAFDSQGYLDSTASCAAPNEAVVFGSTDASRIAICQTPGGSLQYRGVRVRDGARLILPATRSGESFIADNDGVRYTVTASSLEVGAGSRLIREEAMVDFHGSAAAGDSTETTTPESPSETETATPVPDGPPLPAEVGGSGS
ncbi:hypothetical protein BH10ACT9_BH10ACT9_03200 [soil metagenome]